MKTLLRILLIALILQLPALAQEAAKLTPAMQAKMTRVTGDDNITAWVFFTDKGAQLSKRLDSIKANLTEKSRERRLRNRPADQLVDELDAPVYGQYLREIAGKVSRIRHKSRWLNAVSVEVRKSGVDALQALTFVKKIDIVHSAKRQPLEYQEVTAPLEKSSNTFSLNYGGSETQGVMINVPAMHDMGFDGSGVLVAMLDAGFNNLQHEALDHLNILATWDFVNGDAVVEDEPGQMGSGNHGTYTLSTLAGFKEGQLIGPAYGAQFILAKTENTQSELHVEEDNWVAAAEWADSLGADIISSSLGYLNFFDTGEAQYTWEDMDGQTAVVTIGAEAAASRGILVVNSAGNEGAPVPPRENTIIAPSDGEHVLAVGAVSSSGTVASFSSRGPTVDGRIKPDVAAMGVQTFCASPFSQTGYVTINGTSLSCPLVAGGAALVLQANPTWTNQQIMDALRNTASNAATPDNNLGYGIINVHAAATTVTGIAGDDGNLPTQIELYPAFPNPFNPSTTIRYFVPSQTDVTVSVFNLLGQKVVDLFRGQRNRGAYRLTWNAQNVPSGVYFIVLQAAQSRKVQKAILLK